MHYSGGRTTEFIRSLTRHETKDIESAIVFDGVYFSIGGHDVLEDVSFTVQPGSTRIVLGPSGIGKSTILRLILGLALPQQGDVRIFGKSMVHASASQRNELRKRIGMVFQNGALFDSLTVGENVAYGLLEHTNLTTEELEPRVRSFLRLVGLNADFVLDRLPDQLSIGMQRRVAIARALAFNEPQILLYDEPTTGLDPVSVETVTDVILRLRKDLRVTSIVVTHEIPHALKIADNFLFLYDRKVAFEGTAEELAHSDVPALRDFLLPFRISLKQAYSSFTGDDDVKTEKGETT